MSDLPTSNELVKSLRDYSEGPSSYWLPICRKAADEIERLRRENFELQDERVRWMRIYESTITAHEPCVHPFDKLGIDADGVMWCVECLTKPLVIPPPFGESETSPPPDAEARAELRHVFDKYMANHVGLSEVAMLINAICGPTPTKCEGQS